MRDLSHTPATSHSHHQFCCARSRSKANRLGKEVAPPAKKRKTAPASKETVPKQAAEADDDDEDGQEDNGVEHDDDSPEEDDEEESVPVTKANNVKTATLPKEADFPEVENDDED